MTLRSIGTALLEQLLTMAPWVVGAVVVFSIPILLVWIPNLWVLEVVVPLLGYAAVSIFRWAAKLRLDHRRVTLISKL